MTDFRLSGLLVRLYRPLVLAALAGCCAVQGASACMPGEPGDYDSPAADEALAVLASVATYEFEVTVEHVCMKTSYEVREVFWGSAKGTVDTEVCFPNDGDIDVTDNGSFEKSDEMAEYEKALGFYPGALVVTLLTNQKTPGRLFADLSSATEYRPAITSCWMYAQLDVGALPEAERAARIESFRSDAIALFHGDTSEEKIE